MEFQINNLVDKIFNFIVEGRTRSYIIRRTWKLREDIIRVHIDDVINSELEQRLYDYYKPRIARKKIARYLPILYSPSFVDIPMGILEEDPVFEPLLDLDGDGIPDDIDPFPEEFDYTLLPKGKVETFEPTVCRGDDLKIVGFTYTSNRPETLVVYSELPNVLVPVKINNWWHPENDTNICEVVLTDFSDPLLQVDINYNIDVEVNDVLLSYNITRRQSITIPILTHQDPLLYGKPGWVETNFKVNFGDPSSNHAYFGITEVRRNVVMGQNQFTPLFNELPSADIENDAWVTKSISRSIEIVPWTFGTLNNTHTSNRVHIFYRDSLYTTIDCEESDGVYCSMYSKFYYSDKPVEEYNPSEIQDIFGNLINLNFTGWNKILFVPKSPNHRYIIFFHLRGYFINYTK